MEPDYWDKVLERLQRACADSGAEELAEIKARALPAAIVKLEEWFALGPHLRLVRVALPCKLDPSEWPSVCDGCAWDGVFCTLPDEWLDSHVVLKCELREYLEELRNDAE